MSYRPCENANPDCKYFDTDLGCQSNTHHEYWPAYKYKDRVSRIFRATQTVDMCMVEHEELHATTPPPHKPPRQEMIQWLIDNGVSYE